MFQLSFLLIYLTHGMELIQFVQEIYTCSIVLPFSLDTSCDTGEDGADDTGDTLFETRAFFGLVGFFGLGFRTAALIGFFETTYILMNLIFRINYLFKFKIIIRFIH